MGIGIWVIVVTMFGFWAFISEISLKNPLGSILWAVTLAPLVWSMILWIKYFSNKNENSRLPFACLLVVLSQLL